MDTRTARPKFLNLLRIKLPVGAVTSIGHRIAGVLLFFSIPVLIYLLGRSLQGPEQYARIVMLFDTAWLKLLGIAVVWAFAHHLLAGLRLLLLDLRVGIDKPVARAAAWFVNVTALTAVLVYLGSLV